MAEIKLAEVASVATPSAGKVSVYVDSADSLLKSKDDTGAITNYGAPGTAITSLTGDVTASGPGAAAASISSATVTGKVLTGLSTGTGDVVATDTILQAFAKLQGRLNRGWLGNGADGSATITVNTTLVRDMYYSSLTIDPGVTLFTGGFRIFCQDGVTGSGTIDRSGNNGVGSTAGAVLTAGSTGAGFAGGAGGTAAGTAGTASTSSIGTAGGAGGAGSGGAGGAAGAVTVPTAALGGVESLNSARSAVVARDLAGTVMGGGSGGGGGGGDGTAGGGGGSGGGVIVIAAKEISGTLTIRARGGDGGTPAGGNRGGGGGGGGGCIITITEAAIGGGVTLSVAGGVGSSGTGTGVVGSNGSTGRIVSVRT